MGRQRYIILNILTHIIFLVSHYLKLSELVWTDLINKKLFNAFIEKINKSNHKYFLNDSFIYNSEYFLSYLKVECKNDIDLAISKLENGNKDMCLIINNKLGNLLFYLFNS